MSVTLLTAAAIMRGLYEGPAHLPARVEPGPRYDHRTTQAAVYFDRERSAVGCAVQGTNEAGDWWRNFDVRRRWEAGYRVAAGWWRGAEPLAEWCEAQGVVELIGHSKGGAEALLAAWALQRSRTPSPPAPGGPAGDGSASPALVQVLALETPKPFFGTPPLMDALCLRNPLDPVCRLPLLPGWKTPGSTFSLPWEPIDGRLDHSMERVTAALLRPPRHGFFALEDRGPGDDPAVVVKPSRGAEMASGRALP